MAGAHAEPPYVFLLMVKTVIMNKRSLSAAVSLLIFPLAVLLPFHRAGAQQRVVPSSAQLTYVRLTVAEGNQQRTIRALVAPHNSNYFLFPIFDLRNAEISFNGGADFFPLIGQDGQVNTRGAGGKATIRIRVRDVLNSNAEKDVRAALSRSEHPSVNNKAVAIPDVSDNWQVTLEVRNRAAGGQYTPLGTWSFSRGAGADSQVMQFQVTRGADDAAASPYNLLIGASDEDLRLTLSSTFNAEFQTTEYRVEGELVDERTRSLLQRVISSSGGQQPILFVPVGGAVKQQMNIKDLVRRSARVSVVTRQGGQPAPAAEVNLFISRILDQFQDQIKLSAQDHNKMVSFLLDNGIRVTTPIGEVKRIEDYFKTDREKKTHDLLEAASRESTKIAGGMSGGVEILDLVGANSETNIDYQRATAEKKKEVRDRFQRDIEEMSRIVDGNWPAVSAMRLEDIQSITSVNSVSALFNRLQFFEGVKKFDVQLAFDDSGIRGNAGPSAAFRKAVLDSIQASRSSFVNLRRGARKVDEGMGFYDSRIIFPGEEYSRITDDFSHRAKLSNNEMPEDVFDFFEYYVVMRPRGEQDLSSAEALYKQAIADLAASLPNNWKNSGDVEEAHMVPGFIPRGFFACENCVITREPTGGYVSISSSSPFITVCIRGVGDGKYYVVMSFNYGGPGRGRFGRPIQLPPWQPRF